MDSRAILRRLFPGRQAKRECYAHTTPASWSLQSSLIARAAHVFRIKRATGLAAEAIAITRTATEILPGQAFGQGSGQRSGPHDSVVMYGRGRPRGARTV